MEITRNAVYCVLVQIRNRQPKYHIIPVSELKSVNQLRLGQLIDPIIAKAKEKENPKPYPGYRYLTCITVDIIHFNDAVRERILKYHSQNKKNEIITTIYDHNPHIKIQEDIIRVEGDDLDTMHIK